MKQTGNSQINTRVYWNHIYTTPAREVEYWTDNGRFPLLLELINDGDKFIDIGCGVGIPGRLVHQKYPQNEIWGVDISDEVIRNNIASDESSVFRYQQGYAGFNDDLPPEYFNVCFAGEILEHLDEPNKLFEEAYRILRTGGKFIISTPRDDSINSPEHVWEFTEEDVEKLYKDAGFKSVEFKKLPNMEHLSVIFAIGTK